MNSKIQSAQAVQVVYSLLRDNLDSWRMKIRQILISVQRNRFVKQTDLDQSDGTLLKF